MIDIGSLFPRALSQPIPVNQVFENVQPTTMIPNPKGADIVFSYIRQGKSAIQCVPKHILNKYIPRMVNNTTFNFGGMCKRLCSDKPANTLIKTYIPYTEMPIHPVENRYPSIEELQALQGFPLEYVFIGDYKKKYARIGNSVPPLMMRAIAKQVSSVMFGGNPLMTFPKSMTYIEILEQAWKEHLTPREPNAPTVISTFAGGGGSSLGYSMAGYKELLAVEMNNNAVATFKLNFPNVPVFHGDIAKLSVEQCMNMAGVNKGELSLLDGSPPCQGFSISGKRILDDPRNQLFREFVRLLRGLKPKVFVMENVSGLVKGKMKLVFAEIMKELKDSGYQVSARLLNAKYFYVPQSRERLIFIGVRDDLNTKPTHPKAQSQPFTVKDAFVECEDKGFTLTHSAARIVKYMKQGDCGKKFSNKCANEFIRLSNTKPSSTVIKTFRLSGGTGLVHPTYNRHIGIQEVKRLSSFPDKYLLTGTYANKWGIIGNAVPPFLIRSIALHIKRYIGITQDYIRSTHLLTIP